MRSAERCGYHAPTNERLLSSITHPSVRLISHLAPPVSSNTHPSHLAPLKTGELLNTIEAHSDFVKCVRVYSYPVNSPVFPGRTVVFSGSSDRFVRAWDVETGEMLQKYDGHRRGIEDIALSSDGSTFFTACSDTFIRKYDVVTGQCLQTLEGHRTSVYAIYLPEDEESEYIWSGMFACACPRIRSS